MKEILLAACGVIFFLVGMIRLYTAARRLIDVRIKQYIRYAVGKPLYGLVTGIAATAIFQSSSASTTLTVGFVSAGLISFYDSLAIILGTDIGATVVMQFVVWRFTDISPLLVTLGGICWLIGRGRLKTAGEIMFYFGLIFFGLYLVGQATAPLKNSALFIDFFNQTKSPLLGIGLGILFTVIVQASAVPIGVMIILAQQDMVLLENAVPVVLGANIGTTVTALLAATVATAGGRKTAYSHLFFKCAGVVIFLVFLPWFMAVLKNLSASTAQQIVLSHFLLNLLIAIIFIFLLQPVAAIMNKLVPGREDSLSLWPECLNNDDLGNPEKALADVEEELCRAIAVAEKMYGGTTVLIGSYSEGIGKNIYYMEIVINNLRSQIVKYLGKASARSVSGSLSQKLFAYTAIAGDIESMGNHILIIAELARQKKYRNIIFSRDAEKDLQEIIAMVSTNLNNTVTALKMPEEIMIKGIIEREDYIDIKVKEARDRHLERFHSGICRAEAGPVFVEMLIHLERISDHCNNIAEYILTYWRNQ